MRNWGSRPTGLSSSEVLPCSTVICCLHPQKHLSWRVSVALPQCDYKMGIPGGATSINSSGLSWAGHAIEFKVERADMGLEYSHHRCNVAVQSFNSPDHRSQIVDPLQVGTQSLPLLDGLQSEVIWQHASPLHPFNDLVASCGVLCPCANLKERIESCCMQWQVSVNYTMQSIRLSGHIESG